MKSHFQKSGKMMATLNFFLIQDFSHKKDYPEHGLSSLLSQIIVPKVTHIWLVWNVKKDMALVYNSPDCEIVGHPHVAKFSTFWKIVFEVFH